ncbi:MAG: deoxyribodipyrimidine photolyase [Myxococcaceae bacterium]|nr:deoxyribodipyrimidine photolyase [Myxococcaceae bacterium]MCA3016506.1 deoxyribodipyrimidine photolyase [Myxococcaceae bacterium]
MPVPAIRVRALREGPVRPERRWVLYWMTSFRRTRFNFALDRALEHARRLQRPLVVLEALRVGYPDANDRLHAFLLEGMAENARRFAASPVLHFPYVEETAGDGAGLLEALAAEACVVVSDDWPCYFVPRMQQAAARRLDVAFELVDSNGLWPMRATDRVFTTAHSFRAHLQKALAPHLGELPCDAPLDGLALPTAKLPAAITSRWSRAPKDLLEARPQALAALPIDHSVPPGRFRGGSHVGEARLARFVGEKLADYPEARNEPEVDGTSALSPYLHFGHVSVHHVFAEVARRERWTPDVLGRSIGGSKSGWWKMSAAAEAFLDELVTWRELAFNMAALRPDDYGSMDTLPAFAKATHAKHAKDPRPRLYSLEQLERAETHDELWNAAQRQMVRDGWFHNYLRMLWGKKILEWSPSAADALTRMEHLMNKYSLDGRDPCSYSGYLWVLGRYDRAWGPERPIFGSVRYMSSDNTAKKISVKAYLETYRR